MAQLAATTGDMQPKTTNTVPETTDQEIKVPYEGGIEIDCHLKNIIVAEGEPCLMQVRATGPNTNCVWLKNGRPIQETDHIKLVDSRPWFCLELQRTTYKDGGIYTAIFKNQKSYATSQSVVRVINKEQSRQYDTLYLPPFSLTVAKHLQNLIIKPGETITLLAKFKLKPNNNIKYYWFKDDELVSNDLTTYDGNSTQFIKTDAQFNDSGVYMVVAKTSEGIVSSVSEVLIMDLEIKQYTTDPNFINKQENTIDENDDDDTRVSLSNICSKPTYKNKIKVTKPLKSIITVLGKSVFLNCAFEINKKKYLSVIWNVGLYKIENSNSQFQVIRSDNEFILFINQVEPDMFGNVSCELHQTTYELSVTKAVLIQVPQAVIDEELMNSQITSQTIYGIINIKESALRTSAYKHPSEVHSPDAYYEDSACGPLVRREDSSTTKHLDSDDYSKLYFIDDDIPTISTDKISSYQGAGAGVQIYKTFTEALFCRLDNDGPNIFTVWNYDKNEAVITMVDIKLPGKNYNSWILQWNQTDSLPADTCYAVDVCVGGGQYLPVGATRLPMFEIKNPPAEKVILIRIRMGFPVASISDSIIFIEPHLYERPPTTREYATSHKIRSYELFQRSYKKIKVELGRGAYGAVYPVINSRRDMFAVKEIETKTDTVMWQARSEFLLMTLLDHPKIVKVYEGFSSVGIFVFVMDYLWGGNLLNRIVKEKKIDEATAIVYIYQICEGLEYLHANNIVHLDVKPENIVCINPNSTQIKIVDFGLSRVINEESNEDTLVYGTRDYLAPEVLNHEHFTTASDLWSLGVTTYFMLTGKKPFTRKSSSNRISPALNSFGEDCVLLSPNAKSFINGLLVKETNKRLTASLAKAHSWITQTKQLCSNFKSHSVLNERAASIIDPERLLILSYRMECEKAAEEFLRYYIPTHGARNLWWNQRRQEEPRRGLCQWRAETFMKRCRGNFYF